MKLDDRWTKFLCSLPESGMGYQIVDVMLKSGTVLRGVMALNCEELIMPSPHEDLQVDDIGEISLHKP